MSMQLSTFQTFPGGKQDRKSPLNVLVKLFSPACNGDISEVKNNANIQCWFSDFYTQKFEKSIVA